MGAIDRDMDYKALILSEMRQQRSGGMSSFVISSEMRQQRSGCRMQGEISAKSIRGLGNATASGMDGQTCYCSQRFLAPLEMTGGVGIAPLEMTVGVSIIPLEIALGGIHHQLLIMIHQLLSTKENT